jgi:acyl-CoA thioesterase-1
MIKRVVLSAILIVTACVAMIAHASAETLKIVALGDSLTAGYGLGPELGFAVRLEDALKRKGWDVTVINAGVSGDTATGGADRADWSIPDDAAGVIVELGANDALRGVKPEVTLRALDRILARLNERKIPVLLAGMYAPRNMGPDYVKEFDAIYPALAKKYGVLLYPFFLEGVVGDRTLNQADGVHPTAEGVDLIVGSILPTVERFLRNLEGAR